MPYSQAPIWLDQEGVMKLLPDIDLLSVMRETFAAFGHGKAIQPPQALTAFSANRGDFITYSGVLEAEGVFGAKLSPYIVGEDGAKVTAATLLMDMRTGMPLFLCDSLVLTTERTAATTALAVDLLASNGAEHLAIVGAGPVALAHLRQVLPLRNWKTIRIFSPNIASRKDELLSKLGPLASRIEFVADRTAIAKGADVVMLCTSSGKPVIDCEAISKGTLVTSISTNVAGAHEVAPSFLPLSNVYCDARTTTPAIAGEMRLAGELGWSVDEILGDLADLVCSRARMANPNKPSFFRSMGLGIEDISIALAVYRRFLTGSNI